MRLSWWIGTAAGLGRLPAAPGTWASLAAGATYGFIFPNDASLLIHGLFLFIIAATFFAGVWAGHDLESDFGHDPSIVVVDEVVGMWISVFWLPPHWLWILAAFVCFRLFDITKWLGGASAERLPGGWGIMLDDVIAGIWSNVIVQLIRLAID